MGDFRRAIILGVLAAAACGTDDPPADTDTDAAAGLVLPETPEDWVEWLAAPGPYQAAYKEVTVTYTDAAGDERSSLVNLWYPTDATSGVEARYLGGAIPAAGVWLEAAPSAGTFPVVVFSHGHQGGTENLAKVIAHLVRHGWVAVAPTHTGNTTFDGSGRTTQIYWQRPSDVSHALDLVLDIDPLAAHTNGLVFAFGHSFGGYTMYPLGGAMWDLDLLDTTCAGETNDAICSSFTPEDRAIFATSAADDRIAAFATLSGGDHRRFGAAGLTGLDRPRLLVTGLLDGDNPEETASYWGDLPPGEHVRATLAHGDHLSYTDVGGVGGPDDLLDGDRSRSITASLLGAFAYHHVVGAAGLDAVLDGSVEIDPDVTVEAWSAP